jgi:hypothetical protein
MTARGNVMSHPIGLGEHHINRVQNGGNFRSKTLHVFRHRIRDLLHCRWHKIRRFSNWQKVGQNNLVAAGAFAVQANRTWLVSGATVILNFLKESMPRMGPATAGCKNFAVNS